jgi:hypothetical protein
LIELGVKVEEMPQGWKPSSSSTGVETLILLKLVAVLMITFGGVKST